MYESLKNRIAALEEEEVLEEEEERRFGTLPEWIYLQLCSLRFHAAEEAQKSVRGLEENAIHSKYIELVKCRLSTSTRIFFMRDILSSPN